MNAKAYADLEQRIQDWMDAWCEAEEWPEVIIGNETVANMATAARVVLDACVESQRYAKQEGYVTSHA